MESMDTPFMRLGEVGLLILVTAHAFNGIRLSLIDTGVSTRYQKMLFRVAVVIGGLVVVYGSLHLLGGDH